MTTISSNSNTTEAMFSEIAARYDCCNHLFSLGVDRLWRRRLVRLLSPKTDDTALDLCCGTGDMAFAFAKHSPLRQIVGVDCSETMIQLAQEKFMRMAPRRWMANKDVSFSVEDATSLSFKNSTFDLISCVFGLRNIGDRTAALQQMYRVLKPGGRVSICEFSLPKQPVIRTVFWFYLSRIMPLAGRAFIGDAEPLKYLAASILRWHKEVCLEDELRRIGFQNIGTTVLTGGIVTITVAQRP
jgi:demethylmenaquinone methyltransferase/2-methoxy-6-polyprenyl-1,4-benzoquinol methylase